MRHPVRDFVVRSLELFLEQDKSLANPTIRVEISRFLETCQPRRTAAQSIFLLRGNPLNTGHEIHHSQCSPCRLAVAVIDGHSHRNCFRQDPSSFTKQPLRKRMRADAKTVTPRRRQSLEAVSFPVMPTKRAAKKPAPLKTKAIKPVQENTDNQKKPASDKGEGFRVLKQVLHLSPGQKKPAADKVEHLVRDYLAELREVDRTYENGASLVEKYCNKYPELFDHVRTIAPEERRIEITQNLGEDADLRRNFFVIRILDDSARYEVMLAGEEEQKIVKSSEWLSLLQDTLARVIAKILYARETSKAGE
jgi:hypothetical protein